MHCKVPDPLLREGVARETTLFPQGLGGSIVDPSSKAHHTTSILPSVVSAQMYNTAAQLALHGKGLQSALRARSVGKGFATVSGEMNIMKRILI